MAKAKIKVKPGEKQREELIEQLTGQWQRAVADYQNLEKRTAAEKVQYYKLASATLITRLLPVLDGLSQAQQHLKDPGLELIGKQLMAVLTDEGLAEIEALGQPFDPLIMECVEQVSGEKNVVVRVDQKGFRLHELVIRPAKVAVGTEERQNL